MKLKREGTFLQLQTFYLKLNIWQQDILAPIEEVHITTKGLNTHHISTQTHNRISS